MWKEDMRRGGEEKMRRKRGASSLPSHFPPGGPAAGPGLGHVLPPLAPEPEAAVAQLVQGGLVVVVNLQHKSRCLVSGLRGLTGSLHCRNSLGRK